MESFNRIKQFALQTDSGKEKNKTKRFEDNKLLIIIYTWSCGVDGFRWVLVINLTKFLTSQYDVYKSNMTNGIPQGHFLMFPQKTLNVYEDTEVCREEYLFS